MLDEDAIVDPQDVRYDPVHGCPEPGKTSVDNDDVAVSDDHPRLDTDQEFGAVLDRLERATMVALDPSVLFPGADLKPSCSLSCSRRTP
jgi:hypothetical protein